MHPFSFIHKLISGAGSSKGNRRNRKSVTDALEGLERRELMASIITETMGIHKIIYGGQSINVPLYVTNTGNTIASGNVTIDVYLSQVDLRGVFSGDKLLLADVNQSLSIKVGGQEVCTLTVAIPSATAAGVYYIKTETLAATENSILAPNYLLLTRSLPLSDIDPMNSARASVYEQAVTAAKASPSFVPPSIQMLGFTDAGFQAYIKTNEGWENGPYLDSGGVPTLGWGFALQDRNTQGVLVNDPLAVTQFNALDVQFKAANKIGWIDPRTGGHLTFAGLIQLASLNGGNTAKPLKYQIPAFTQAAANPWFIAEYTSLSTGVANTWNGLSNTTVQFNSLALNIRLALVDMSYNMGGLYLTKFPKMAAFINAGGNSLASAGFELMDSDYATGAASRATSNYRLIVSGYEAEL